MIKRFTPGTEADSKNSAIKPTSLNPATHDLASLTDDADQELKPEPRGEGSIVGKVLRGQAPWKKGGSGRT